MDREAIERRILAGETYAQIAKEAGLTRSRVSQIAGQIGAAPRISPDPDHDLVREIRVLQQEIDQLKNDQDAARRGRDEAIIEALEGGASIYKLAKEAGIPEQTIQWVIKKNQPEK